MKLLVIVAAIMAITLINFLILALTTYEVSGREMTSIQCGTANFTRELIWYGNKTERGEWPFLTALFKVKEEEENEFFCGGTLVSSKHVLTGTI